MTQDGSQRQSQNQRLPYQTKVATNYYRLLGLHPSASVVEIRRSYRELSKQYHPDTTDLPTAIATVKFQQLNEAYATLSNPERRQSYDLSIGYSRWSVIQPTVTVNRPQTHKSSAAYLDPTDRPLSAGEIFALFILGLTFVGCLVVAIAIGLTRGDTAIQLSSVSLSSPPPITSSPNPSITSVASLTAFARDRI